jgi:magnesium-transporting ATPase (P-type)
MTWDGEASVKLGVWKTEAKSVILLGIRDASTSSFSLAAILAVADQLRPEASSVISWLHHQGIGTWMVSGDNLTTAEAVARTVGIPETNVMAGVLPHEKVYVCWRRIRCYLTKPSLGRQNSMATGSRYQEAVAEMAEILQQDSSQRALCCSHDR